MTRLETRACTSFSLQNYNIYSNETFEEFLLHYRLQNYYFQNFNPRYEGVAVGNYGTKIQKLKYNDIMPLWIDALYLSIR